MSNTGRAPKDYNAGAWGRILGRIDKAIASIGNRLSDSEKQTRELQATQREQRGALVSMLTPEATFEWSEYVDAATDIVYAQCIVEVTRGWAIIADFEYRDSDGNVNTATPWTSYTTGADMSFVANASYKGGGYYLYRRALPFQKANDFVSTVTVDLRGKAANGDVWLQSSHTFDANTVPQFRSEPKLVLQWYNTTEKWQVRAVGEADDDTLSVGFYVSDNVELSAIDGFVEGDFTTGVTNMSGNDKRFNVLLGSFTPATKASPRTVYVAAGAFDGASATTDNPDNAFTSVLLSIEIPVSPTASGILGAGDITGEYLADSVKTASVNLIANHNSSTPSSVVDVSGTIEYRGDTSTGNPYTIGLQSITLDTTGVSQSSPNGPLTYIYFDPSLNSTALRVTTSKSEATDVTGKRIFVGIGRAHFAERAFFVFANDQPVFSAPFIFASKLEALTATMGTLRAGNAKIGDNVNGSNDGLYIGTHNYWYDTGVFKVGSGTDYIEWDGSNLNITSIPVSYNQSAQPTGNIKYGDLWYDSTPNVQALKWYDGANWSIIGDTLQRFYAPSSTTTISGDKIRTGALESNNWSTTAGSQLDLTYGTIKLGGSLSPAFSVTSAGLMSCTGATVSGAITATSGSITGSFSVGAALSIGSGGSLSIGGSTFATAGIQAEYNGGTPRLYAGNGSDKYIKWDGSALTVAGDIYDAAGSKIFDAATKTISNNAVLQTLTIGGQLSINSSGSIVAGDVADGSIFSSSGIDFIYDRAGGVGAVHRITWTNENSSESVTLGYTSTYNSPAGVYLVDDWRITSAVDVVISAPNISLSGTAKVGSNTIWHAGNDGTGSGLDADLLDGNHASAFLTASSSIGDSQLSSNVPILAVTPDTGTVTPDSRLKFDVGGYTYYIAAEEAP